MIPSAPLETRPNPDVPNRPAPRPGMPASLAHGAQGLLLGLTLLASGAAQVPPPDRLDSTIFKWEELEVRPTGNGQRRNVTDRPTATLERFECHVTTLLPGRLSHPPHQHPQEELIILHEGTLEVTIDGRTQRAGPGSLLFFAANDFHNVRNAGDGPATYFVFNFATAATRALDGRSAAGLAVAGRLASAVHEWTELAVTPTRTGEVRRVFNSPTTTLANFSCHNTTLKPGLAAHAPHRHPDDEIVLVREGTLDVTVNGVTTRAGAGSVFFFSSNDVHGMSNAGDTPASYYVLRVVTDLTPQSVRN